ncbi:MAG: uroporphyrinogen decarboxylase [Alphaproteobacteria bacterium]|nr:uroporphyrinogen decarboxylase [Alphaproteobacteria bacterium]
MGSPVTREPSLLVRALRGEKTERAPFWFMRQAGRYLPEYRALRAEVPDFIGFCLDPARAAEVTLQPIRRFGMDGAILFADILLVPYALGLEVSFKEGVGPQLAVVRTRADVEQLAGQTATSADRLAPVYETVTRVRGALPDACGLIGFAGSPWTVATYMVEGGGGHDFIEVRRFARRDPGTFGLLIDVLVEATIAYLDRQIVAGADAVQLFDTWAGILAADEFDRWCIAPTRRIVEAIRARHPTVPVIGFPRGAGTSLLRYAGETGIDAVGLDAGVAPSWAALALPGRVALQGNLDPILMTVGGEPMLAAARAILAAWRDRAFVFNLGHGITPDVPIENVAALSRIIQDWRRPDRPA